MNKGILVSLLYLCCGCGVAQNRIADLIKYNTEVEKIALKSEELAYMDQGTGDQTLIFIHGLSSNLGAWSKNIKDLKDDYRCIALDLPGYGKSSRNRTDYSLSEYASFIDEFIRKKNLKNVILAGHSMGGQIAIHTVLEHPQHFEKMILIAPAGIETFTEKEAELMKSSYNSAIVMAASEEQIRNNFKLNFYEFPEDAEFMVEDRIAMKQASDFEDYAAMVVNNIHAMLDEPVLEKMNEIQIPVLLIYGKNDLLIPNKYFHPNQDIVHLLGVAEAKIKNLKVELIDEAGHFVNFEKSEKVNKIITEFIEN